MQVGVHDVLVVLVGVRFETAAQVGARDVKEDIDVSRFIGGAADGSGVFDIHFDGAALQVGGEAVQFVFGAGREDDAGTRVVHAAGYGEADAAAGARNQRGLTFE